MRPSLGCADRFYEALIKLMAKFDLQIAEKKAKILEFGLIAKENRKAFIGWSIE
ncbi:hypothetical protein [Paenibacillus sp. FSL K6-0108]|uniref:hypothetical protein n=1 Tax=Paenibacillus sp. FSL K6-0108 TaxID=2921417 RepID=UPI00324FD75B